MDLRLSRLGWRGVIAAAALAFTLIGGLGNPGRWNENDWGNNDPGGCSVTGR